MSHRWSLVLAIAIFALGCAKTDVYFNQGIDTAASDNETDSDTDADADIDTDVDSDSGSESETGFDTDASYIDLTPETGTTTQDQTSGYGNDRRGYHVVPTTDLHVVAVEWWVHLPDVGNVEARICAFQESVLAVGTYAMGDGTEKWYRSELDVTLEAGEEYIVAFSVNTYEDWSFDHKYWPDEAYEIPGYFEDVWASFNWPADAYCPSVYSIWAPFMRIEIAD